eukprot:TRINITY_DN30982_c0_g1_i1.p1 TRINITY_DN30982_c0_g1~~TRINITY_DN30982_c0_g1_i1.p1  ORF type:complete len:444 (+),score=89.32 TRINITY_DN30982_c0_g1_i1:82-1332(+)
MSKLQLAQGFELGKRAVAEEQRADELQKGWLKSSDRDIAKMKAAYKKCYTTYMECLENFNAVRNNPSSDSNMIQFCTEQMQLYMSKCENVKEKENNILLPPNNPIPQKDGYVFGEVIFERRPEQKVKPKEVISYDGPIGEGPYCINVKYLDNPSVTSSTVLVQVLVETKRGATQKWVKHLPSFTQWSRNVGVASIDAPARLRLSVSSNSWLRSLQLHVTIHELVEANNPLRDIIAPPLPPYSMQPQPALPTINEDLLKFEPPQDAPALGTVSVDDIAALTVTPAEGPSWDEAFREMNKEKNKHQDDLGPPPDVDIADILNRPSVPAPSAPVPSSTSGPATPLAALIRAAEDAEGTGCPVPMHSVCPQSMTDLRRVHASVTQWVPKKVDPDQPAEDASEFADFLSKLPKPTEMDPPS